MKQERNFREIAQKLLEQSPFIGDDYFKMEDYIVAVLEGKNPQFPQVRGPEFYHVLQDVEDALYRNFEYPDTTPELLEDMAYEVLERIDTQNYDEVLDEVAREMGEEL